MSQDPTTIPTTTAVGKTGAQLLLAELERQQALGYSAEKDLRYQGPELELAGDCYATPASHRQPHPTDARKPLHWPWPIRYWHPEPENRHRELIKAGALYWAEARRYNALGVQMTTNPDGSSKGMLSGILASKYGPHYERNRRKGSFIAGLLNCYWLRSLGLTQIRPDAPIPDQARIYQALLDLQFEQLTSNDQLLVLQQNPEGINMHRIRLEIMEYPALTTFVAAWIFAPDGQLAWFTAFDESMGSTQLVLQGAHY